MPECMPLPMQLNYLRIFSALSFVNLLLTNNSLLCRPTTESWLLLLHCLVVHLT